MKDTTMHATTSSSQKVCQSAVGMDTLFDCMLDQSRNMSHIGSFPGRESNRGYLNAPEVYFDGHTLEGGLGARTWYPADSYQLLPKVQN